MPASTWLITGASRGIGLEYARQIIEKGDVVFATARTPEKAVELQKLKESAQGSLHIVQLDVCIPESISSAVKLVEDILQGGGIDYLISNAGILNSHDEKPSMIDTLEMLDIFKTNVVGSVLVYQGFLPLIERSNRPGGPVLVNISSGSGSITRAKNADSTSYSVSKAALNMLTVKQAFEKPNIIVIAMAPGWVKTEMGGASAVFDVDFSVRGQLKSIVAATRADSGKYKVHNGSEYTW
ncbi:hypothetical protein Clacol_008455 [Clathrus columnatus]|uniref:NAD(P)-binding protein n=1 Tax=Clathrus columnatus TaxID=1419009 RepID=A0AAV5AL40_9AGAM|nr:hypothetical protein Clacol_008455 [Clathrus columnatus]